MDLHSILNPAQRQAVMHEAGPMLVVAGAGTGKTRVITHRIVRLILDGLAKPSEILALTFTEKASAEMLNRVDEMMPLGYEEIQISTFHAFCDRLLRESGIDAGINTDYQLLTKAEQWLLMKRHLYQFDLHYFRPLGNPVKFIDALLTHFSRAKDEIVSPQDYLNLAWDGLKTVGLVQSTAALDLAKPLFEFWQRLGDEPKATHEDALKTFEVAKAYLKYQELLVGNPKETRLDFGDLILHALNILKSRSSVLERYRRKFKYVLVDEFQDTNFAQNELVKLLAGEHKNLFVVGDDDQSIYRFRGAAVSNILQFQEDFPEAKVVVLTDNYRSTQNILDAAYRGIQENNPDRLEVKANINKKLIGHKGMGASPDVIHMTTLEEETELVARTILDLKGGISEQDVESERGQMGFDALLAEPDVESEQVTHESEPKWSDFVILARANSHLEPFIQTLRYHGIPFKLVGSRGLFSRDEIKDLIAYLKVLTDPMDGLQLFRLLCIKQIGVNSEAVLQLLKFSKAQNFSLWESLFNLDQVNLPDATSKTQILWLRDMIETERAKILDENPGRILLNFVHAIKLLEDLAADENLENTTKILNINKFFERIKKYLTEADNRTVPGFVDYLDLMIEAGDNPATAEVDSSADGVNLMTVHASKGLEFDHVFVVNLVQQRFPTRNMGETIEMPLPLIKEKLPEGDEHKEEERRLFYVAVTRARKRLFFCYGDNYGGVRVNKPSQFIAEALGEKIELKFPLQTETVAIPPTTEGVFDLKPYLPRDFSYSQIETFDKCPLRYKYQYVYRIPVPTSGSSVFGQVIHRTLKDFYTGLAEGRDQSESALMMLFERHWQRDGYDSSEEVQLQYERGKTVLHRFYQDNASTFAPAAKLEENFKLHLGSFTITGYIDRIDKLLDGTYELIDYKTGKISPEDLEKRVVKDEQLSIYALAARDAFHLPVNTFTLYFLESGQRASASRSPAQLEVMTSKLEQACAKISHSDFAPTASKFVCGQCPFRQICPFAE